MAFISRLTQVPPMALDRSVALPLYRQIASQLRRAIVDGRLRPGAQLPAIRSLAEELGVGRITVINAYDQLAAEGYITGQVGSGTRVVDSMPEETLSAVPVRPVGPAAANGRSRHRLPPLASRTRRMVDVAGRTPPVVPRFDFRVGNVGHDLLPDRAWERSLRTAWAELREGASRRLLGYYEPAGDPILREALAEYLGVARAVRCTADDLIVTRGTQAALAGAAFLFLEPGRTCVIEEPGYPYAHRAALLAGARLCPVPADDDGLRTADLPDAASMAIVAPSWQYPLGGTMSLARRRELLQWAEAVGAVVVEDDYDSELRYRGHPVTSLQGLDAGERVLYTGTLSKMIFPGLGLGFAVVPAQVRETYAQVLRTLGRGPSAVAQRAAAIFIRDGHLDRHLRRLRVAYAARQAALLEAIGERLPGMLEATGQAAGMHVVATIVAPGWTAPALRDAAAAAGIGVDSLEECYAGPAPHHRILLNYTGMEPDQLRAGIESLRGVLTAS